MPVFLCPCCGESYLVPLAFCESILEEHIRGGWQGTIAPARCVSCQQSIAAGDPVIIRRGNGVSQAGETHDIPPTTQAMVVAISTWEGEGSIFLVRLQDGKEVYVTRQQIAPAISGTGPK